MKVTLLTIGKFKSKEFGALAADYAQRIAHYLPSEYITVKDEKKALEKISQMPWYSNLSLTLPGFTAKKMITLNRGCLRNPISAVERDWTVHPQLWELIGHSLWEMDREP